MSSQNALTRVRAPRVQITYDVETGDAIEKKELPFVIGVLSDLSGISTQSTELKDRSFIYIDSENINSVMKSINPKLKFDVMDMISEEGKKINIELEFSQLDDFNPGNIALRVPFTKEVLDIRMGLIDLSAKIDGNLALEAKLEEMLANEELRNKILSDVDANAANLKEMLQEVNALRSEEDLPNWQRMFSAFANALKTFPAVQTTDPYGFLIKMIGNLDDKLSKQMDEIVHVAEFKKLEASWLGLNFLVRNVETGPSLKIRLLCLTRDELQRDIERAVEFDQSCLFKKIYESEYGTLGGVPYSCLVADFEFGRAPQDVVLARGLASIAAAAHAPLLTGLHPNMLDMDSFENIPAPRALSKLFESSELVSWNSFRNTEDARYMAFILPRILMRLPYGEKTKKIDTFAYEESVDGEKNDKFCWGNPAYAMAQKIATSFSLYGWTAAIRGAEGGGKVDQLPAYTFKTINGDTVLKCPTEVSITDRREKELSDLGFIALCHAKGTDYAVFFGGQTAQKPKAYNLDAATENAAISARLPYMLNASRFAHYIKIMMRDKIGSFSSKKEIEIYLQNWIAGYVLLSDEGSNELKSKFPLREAKITVVDVPGAPGTYKAVIFLRPHFQLEELRVSMRLVSALPAA